MAYTRLGWRSALGAPDTTGNNPGNWTVTFDPAAINVNVAGLAGFECYKIVVTGGAPNSTFNVFVNNAEWDTTVYAVNNSWDANQVLLLLPGDTIYFYYSDPSSDGFQPKVTIWLRYESSPLVTPLTRGAA